MSFLTLKEEQKVALAKHVKMLNNSHFTINTSYMGSGKSFLSTSLAAFLGLTPVVVSLAAVLPPAADVLKINRAWLDKGQVLPLTKNEKDNAGPWRKAAFATRNLKGALYYSRESVALINKNTVKKKDKLLDGEKVDVLQADGSTKEISRYTPSDFLRKLVDEGCLFIMDEFHAFKNSSNQNHAVCIMANYIRQQVEEHKSKSRMIFLSGTPFDNTTNVVNVMAALGLFVYNKVGTKDLKFPAALSKFLKKIDEKEFGLLSKGGSYVSSYDNVPHSTASPAEKYLAAYGIIRHHLSWAMPRPKLEVANSVNDYFARFVADDERERFITATNDLQELSISMENKDKANPANIMSQITRVMQNLEYSKLPLFIKLVRDKLAESPNNRVVIFFTYSATIQNLQAHLSGLGITSITYYNTDKISNIDIFRSGQTQVLIASLDKGSVGVEFNDTTGKYPTTTFICPGYKMLSNIQASGRTGRIGTKSDAYVYFVYGQVADGDTQGEKRLLSNIQRKREVVKYAAGSGNTDNDETSILNLGSVFVEAKDGTLKKTKMENFSYEQGRDKNDVDEEMPVKKAVKSVKAKKKAVPLPKVLEKDEKSTPPRRSLSPSSPRQKIDYKASSAAIGSSPKAVKAAPRKSDKKDYLPIIPVSYNMLEKEFSKAGAQLKRFDKVEFITDINSQLSDKVAFIPAHANTRNVPLIFTTQGIVHANSGKSVSVDDLNKNWTNVHKLVLDYYLSNLGEVMSKLDKMVTINIPKREFKLDTSSLLSAGGKGEIININADSKVEILAPVPELVYTLRKIFVKHVTNMSVGLINYLHTLSNGVFSFEPILGGISMVMDKEKADTLARLSPAIAEHAKKNNIDLSKEKLRLIPDAGTMFFFIGKYKKKISQKNWDEFLWSVSRYLTVLP